MEHFQIVAEGADGNHAVGTRSDGQSLAPRNAIKVHGLQEDVAPEGSLDYGKGRYSLACSNESGLGIESLQHFLHHRQAGYDLVEIYE